MHKLLYITACVVILFSNELSAQDTASAAAPGSAAELAQKLANPISSLISLPFQNNTEFRIGPDNGAKNTLNIQPVIPVSLTAKVNLITRFILPVIAQQNITGPGSRQAGLGDATLSAFLSPSAAKKGITWGLGPVFLLPTATNRLLGTTKFGMGPTGVFLAQTKGWTMGALVNQIFSVAGYDDTRNDVSFLYLQPFITKNWKSGAGLGISSEITLDWKSGTQTYVLIPTISGITKVGKQTISLAIAPKFGFSSKYDPYFGLRAAVTLVFPK